MSGKLLTVREVAEVLCMSPATVYGLCQARRLRHERYGLGRGTIRIPAEAVDEYRESVTVSREEVPPAPVVKPAQLKLRHLRLKHS